MAASKKAKDSAKPATSAVSKSKKTQDVPPGSSDKITIKKTDVQKTKVVAQKGEKNVQKTKAVAQKGKDGAQKTKGVAQKGKDGAQKTKEEAQKSKDSAQKTKEAVQKSKDDDQKAKADAPKVKKTPTKPPPRKGKPEVSQSNAASGSVPAPADMQEQGEAPSKNTPEKKYTAQRRKKYSGAEEGAANSSKELTAQTKAQKSESVPVEPSAQKTQKEKPKPKSKPTPKSETVKQDPKPKVALNTKKRAVSAAKLNPGDKPPGKNTKRAKLENKPL